MAQKQFKIGLSNTDKQNMAQDVYERVLALTFNEYDTTTEYEVGDFVVYNDQLYKCISATSGAWDGSKWQLATLNDLVDDIENAVAFVNDKANVDGNYPTMTVGVADNLSPYDESAGADQDEPFSFQATGTGNGSQPDFSTGSIALMKEKQGNTVVVNQAVKTKTLSFTTTSTSAENLSDEDYTFISGHKYLITANQSNALTSVVRNLLLINASGYGLASLMSYGSSDGSLDLYATENVNLSAGFKATIFTCSTSVTGSLLYWCSTPNADVTISEINVIDLTQWFNGNIPAYLLDHPEHFFRYYQGSLAYNEGELVNSNGRYLKTIGRNQWDEETVVVSTQLVAKNPIKVVPNLTYAINSLKLANIYSCLADGTKIENLNIADLGNYGYKFTIPSNAQYIKFELQSSYGTTYNHDITISIYYDGESGYDQYYPYEELANIDTGTEVLRSAGSVKDSKAPDGTITRRVGTQDLSQLSWTLDEGDGYWFWRATWSAGQKVYASGSTTRDCISTKYKASNQNNIGLYDNELSWGANTIYVRNDDKNTQPSGTLFYALEEPTTEQGTTFSENVAIDDFGSMDFGGDNGVPQGANIFYPVDYKAFVDTLYKYTDGAPSKIALKSDLSADKTELQGVDTQLLNAVGGTLRQCLCVKETLDFLNTDVIDLGTLNWTYTSLNGVPCFNASGSFSNAQNTKCLCTKYANQDGYQTTDKSFTLSRGTPGTVFVWDTAYTDATTFKNAMKGVLLAYEKASE